jgi:teichuronic acid exporter
MTQQSSAAGDHASTGPVVILHQAARGVFYVASGQTLLLLFGLVAGIFLSRLLTPMDFGIYAIVSLIVLRLSAVAELGLNTKLIHDDRPPMLTHMRSLFTLHCVLALTVYVVLYLAAPFVSSLLQLGPDGTQFSRIVALLILLQPFKAIPLGLLTRHLRYDRLTAVDLVHGLAFQTITVSLAALGYSHWSFAWAVLIASALAALLLNAFSPWRLGFAWDTSYLRGAVRFGGSFQLSSLTAVARDNIATFLGGPLFGPTAVGLLNWSLRLAWVCTQTYVGICARIAFPSLARVRSQPALFELALTKMLRYVNLATFLTLSVVLALAPEIVHFVFTDKWAPAIPLFYCFAVRMIAGNFTTLLDAGISAQGRPAISLRVMSIWTLWEWVLALAGAALFGYAGIAVASAVGIWLALVWLRRELLKVASVNLWGATRTPLVAAVVTFVLIHWTKGSWIHGLPSLLLTILAGILVYIAAVVLLEGRRFWSLLRADVRVVLRSRVSDVPLARQLST